MARPLFEGRQRAGGTVRRRREFEHEVPDGTVVGGEQVGGFVVHDQHGQVPHVVLDRAARREARGRVRARDAVALDAGDALLVRQAQVRQRPQLHAEARAADGAAEHGREEGAGRAIVGQVVAFVDAAAVAEAVGGARRVEVDHHGGAGPRREGHGDAAAPEDVVDDLVQGEDAQRVGAGLGADGDADDGIVVAQTLGAVRGDDGGIVEGRDLVGDAVSEANVAAGDEAALRRGGRGGLGSGRLLAAARGEQQSRR